MTELREEKGKRWIQTSGDLHDRKEKQGKTMNSVAKGATDGQRFPCPANHLCNCSFEVGRVAATKGECCPVKFTGNLCIHPSVYPSVNPSVDHEP